MTVCRHGFWTISGIPFFKNLGGSGFSERKSSLVGRATSERSCTIEEGRLLQNAERCPGGVTYRNFISRLCSVIRKRIFPNGIRQAPQMEQANINERKWK
jgi:hypothetical protein